MKAYKGFNRDMTCLGFQYKEGGKYEKDNAKVCECGFHACEHPLDCLGYYTPGDGSVYHEAALSAPPRNCDRFNSEREMQFAFLAELMSMGINGASLEEYSKWLLAESKGASDEGK
jgi:hypothetical protein